MIVYLHGFGSTGSSPKVDAIRREFPQESIVAPDLPVEPRLATQVIAKTVHDAYRTGERKVLFMGTSLGGFYSWWASARFDAPAILINPATQPQTSTARYLGPNKNFATGETFEWTQEYLDQLAELSEWTQANYDRNLIEVVVAMNDALLDAHGILDRFAGHSTHEFADGGHRFDQIDRVFPLVRQRYENIREQHDRL